MEMSSKNKPPPTVVGAKAFHRAIGVLRAFTDQRPKLTLTELAAEVGLSKSTAHRILAALEMEGLVSRSSESGNYRLGPDLIVLGARALRSVDVREACQGELRSLADETGEDVTLECLVGDEVLVLDEEKGRRLMGRGSPVGSLWPAHATATGKVLLAFSDEPLREPPGGLVRLTDHTIVSWGELMDALEDVRSKGFATNVEEVEYGFVYVAAPVRDRPGRVLAAMSVGGSTHRIGKDQIDQFVEIIQAAALRVSERLGYRNLNLSH